VLRGHYDGVVTLSPSTTPVRFSDLEGALAVLRERGLRVSMARRMILRALFAAAGPLSAESIAAATDAGREGALDAASVYRNLEAFERVGVVRHVHLGHGPGLYALVGEGEREYLYCEGCGAAVGVAPAELEDLRGLIRERFGYRAHFTHFPIVGRCERCAQAERD
jgi:Fur family ferric uptake transcriptional regulator